MRGEWEFRNLKEVVTIKGRIGYRGYTKQDIVSEGEGAITLSPSNIIDNRFVTDKCTYISWFKYDESPEIKIFEEDILFVKTGSSYGKTALVKDLKEKATINPQIVVLKEIKCSNKFLYYLMNTLYFEQEIEKIVGGSAIPTISQANLGLIEIPIPPLEEQQQIVAILDEAFAAIEQAKANIEKNIENTKEIFQSKLNNIFSQKGDGWEEKTLGDVFTFRQGIQRGVKLQSESQAVGQVRFLRIVDYTQGNELPRYIENPGNQYIVNENDISLVRYGASTGFVSKGLSGALANNLFRVIPKSNFNIHLNYLYYFLNSPVFQSYIKSKRNGAAMPAISFGMISKISFPIIPFSHQEKLASEIATIEIKSIKLGSTFERKLQNLEELKKSILQKAFAGELTNKMAEV